MQLANDFIMHHMKTNQELLDMFSLAELTMIRKELRRYNIFGDLFDTKSEQERLDISKVYKRSDDVMLLIACGVSHRIS